jgi:two-component system nitrogen regulation sensor histidine kinase NtrY
MLSKGIKTIISEVENLTILVNEFSQFARFPDTKLGTYDIIAMLDEVLLFLRDTHRRVEFRFTHEENEVYLLVDGIQVRRAILNVLYNSINAMHDEGVISIDGYPSKGLGGEKGKYTIAITDNGEGIGDEIRERIFEPYFSTNSEGTGLGLSIVEKIVLDNRGRIWFESQPGATTFYMEFQRT